MARGGFTVLREAPRLEPEDDEGSVEYKWRLNPQSMSRLESLGTQMKFRIVEGGGVCWYYIGYRDDGDPKGLSEAELDNSLQTLDRIANSINAVVRVKEVFRVHARPKTKKSDDPAIKDDGSPLYTALCVVTPSQSSQFPCSAPSRFLGRVAFVGLPGVGKTTLIGALVSESRDDGRGSLRLSTSKLVHEVLNGGTTCAATSHILQCTGHPGERLELLDLPALTGKYRKTLLKALVTKPIDLIVLVQAVDQKATAQSVWLEELDIPLLQVVSKADMCNSSESGLRVSTVTGEGLECLKETMAARLRTGLSRQVHEHDQDEGVVVSVDELWMKEAIYVVGGVLERGRVKKGMTLRLQSSRMKWEMCKVVDIRNEAGEEVDEFCTVDRYCTVGIELLRQSIEEISTATSSAGEYLRSFPYSIAKIKRLVKPPVVLSSEVLELTHTIKITGAELVPDSHCMVYWRGHRQEARVTHRPDGEEMLMVGLKKPGFFHAGRTAKLIIETSDKRILVATGAAHLHSHSL